MLNRRQRWYFLFRGIRVFRGWHRFCHARAQSRHLWLFPSIRTEERWI